MQTTRTRGTISKTLFGNNRRALEIPRVRRFCRVIPLEERSLLCVCPYSEQLDAQIARNDAEFNAARTLGTAQNEAFLTKGRNELSDSLNAQKDELSSELATIRTKALIKKTAAANIVTTLERQLDEHGGWPGANPGNPDSTELGRLITWIAHISNPTNIENINQNATNYTATASAAADATKAARDNQNAANNASNESDTECANEIDLATAQNDYDNAISTANENYSDAIIESANIFIDATGESFTTYSDYISSLACLYTTAVNTIDNGGNIATNYFSNPTEDAEVCFIAGTPILMADGTSKPIEQIRPGDMVLAVDHNDPENDTPKPAKVTRFFDNGEKDVVKLIFENPSTKEQMEITCTPNHRFYIKEKGWTTADSLVSGDQCVSAERTDITFVSREELQSLQHVYNFEVEDRHTYYVGRLTRNAIVAHNACSVCGNKVYSSTQWLIWESFPTVSLCETCGNAFVDPETFARMFLNGNSYSYAKYWGFKTHMQYITYLKGCVGISSVAVNYEKSPFFTDGTKFYKTYSDAADAYYDLKEKGESKIALIAFSSDAPISVVTENRPIMKADLSYDHMRIHDYSLLAELNINGKTQPVWIHATETFNRDSNYALISQFSNPHSLQHTIYMVLANVDAMQTLKFELNFDISRTR